MARRQIVGARCPRAAPARHPDLDGAALARTTAAVNPWGAGAARSASRTRAERSLTLSVMVRVSFVTWKPMRRPCSPSHARKTHRYAAASGATGTNHSPRWCPHATRRA